MKSKPASFTFTRNSQSYRSIQTKRKRKFSLIFVASSLILFTCPLIFFAFSFAWCELALRVSELYNPSYAPDTELKKVHNYPVKEFISL